MQIQIRQSAFETNSSSSHSITVAENTVYDLMDLSIIPDEKGIVIINGQCFGWEWRRYNDARTKAAYCMVDGKTDLLKEVIKEQTGAKDVIINTSDDYYIDHQSCGTTYDLSTREKLRDFIFNKNSWLFTGNDNEDPPLNFYNTDKPMYKVKLRFDEIEKYVCDKDRFNNLHEAIECQLVDRIRERTINGLYEEWFLDIENKKIVRKYKNGQREFYTFWFDENDNAYTLYLDLNQFPIISNNCADSYYLRERLNDDWRHEMLGSNLPKEFTENFEIVLENSERNKETDKWEVINTRTLKVKAELVPYNQTDDG